MPQPGHAPKPSNLDRHNEASFSLTGIKNKTNNAAAQKNNSRCLRNHGIDMKKTVFILCATLCTQYLCVEKIRPLYFPKAPIFVLNIFTAIASNITPKNLRTASSPASPSMCSINFNDFSTM